MKMNPNSHNFFMKPFDDEKFMAAVREALNQN